MAVHLAVHNKNTKQVLIRNTAMLFLCDFCTGNDLLYFLLVEGKKSH